MDEIAGIVEESFRNIFYLYSDGSVYSGVSIDGCLLTRGRWSGVGRAVRVKGFKSSDHRGPVRGGVYQVDWGEGLSIIILRFD